MLKIENFEVIGWEHAIRGMRNPMNSWDRSDSGICKGGIDGICCSNCANHNRCRHTYDYSFQIGKNDYALMMKLAAAGPVHGKFRRMIVVYVDITAPLYWWKEFDTYKVGTVANSCSTMHKIQAKKFELDDFSHEHLISNWVNDNPDSFVFEDRNGCEKALWSPIDILELIIKILNTNRDVYLKSQNKKFWWQMIQLIPSSYNQKRTVMLNYEVLAGIYPMRKDHKLDEWQEFCGWIEQLPWSELITGEEKQNG